MQVNKTYRPHSMFSYMYFTQNQNFESVSLCVDLEMRCARVYVRCTKRAGVLVYKRKRYLNIIIVS